MLSRAPPLGREEFLSRSYRSVLERSAYRVVPAVQEPESAITPTISTIWFSLQCLSRSANISSVTPLGTDAADGKIESDALRLREEGIRAEFPDSSQLLLLEAKAQRSFRRVADQRQLREAHRACGRSEHCADTGMIFRARLSCWVSGPRRRSAHIEASWRMQPNEARGARPRQVSNPGRS